MGNTTMIDAQRNKNDEFYTSIKDIEKELFNYKDFFLGKHVFMNCDDPEESNFWRYFKLNFDFFGLKKITSTYYHDSEPTYRLDYNGKDIIKTKLEQNGDFRSPESIEILKEADVIVTNPPFSLFREYIAQLMKYNKKFIILGNTNAIGYQEVFPLLKNNKVWFGNEFNKTMEFQVPDHYPLTGSQTRIDEDGVKYVKVPAIAWYTNIDTFKRHEDMILYEKYNEEEYPKLDNYKAIEVNRVNKIPKDYPDEMAVPITFFGRHNPEQFEIIGITDRQNSSGLRTKKYTREDSSNYNDLNRAGALKRDDGSYKPIYTRLLIKRTEESLIKQRRNEQIYLKGEGN